MCSESWWIFTRKKKPVENVVQRDRLQNTEEASAQVCGLWESWWLPEPRRRQEPDLVIRDIAPESRGEAGVWPVSLSDWPPWVRQPQPRKGHQRRRRRGDQRSRQAPGARGSQLCARHAPASGWQPRPPGGGHSGGSGKQGPGEALSRSGQLLIFSTFILYFWPNLTMFFWCSGLGQTKTEHKVPASAEGAAPVPAPPHNQLECQESQDV